MHAHSRVVRVVVLPVAPVGSFFVCFLVWHSCVCTHMAHNVVCRHSVIALASHCSFVGFFF